MKDLSVWFNLPGRPQGKERHRTTKEGHTYTPTKTKEYENRVKGAYWMALHAMGVTLNDRIKTADIELEIEAVYPVAASESKTKQALKIAGHVKPRSKPDLDNVAKIVMDGLNDFAYKDDAQVTRLVAVKRFGTEPGVYVRVIHRNCIGERLWTEKNSEK